MKKRQGQLKETPSKVLLTCVYDTVIIDVTNEVVYSRFSPFGPILKILIFQKGEVTKFFLEFLQVQNAVKAKEFLDGSKLYQSICKMNIYYSNFSSVDLKHETTEGVSLQTLAYSPAPPYYYYPANPYLQYPCYISDYSENDLLRVTQNFQNLSLNKQNYPYQYFIEPSCAQFEQNIDKNIQNSIDWLLRSEQKKSEVKNEESLKDSQQKSCFLSFEMKSDLSNRNIYNLFSNFGNISYIKKTKKQVYIKFRSIQFAAMAKNYLHGYALYENQLNLIYITDLSKAQPKQEEYSQITYFDTSFDRFTPQKSITINPPGNTIHISSLRRESCKVDNLRYIFEQFGPVEAVQILGNNYDKNMALIKFSKTQDSFAAVAEMHNKQILGRKIQISFTKSKVY